MLHSLQFKLQRCSLVKLQLSVDEEVREREELVIVTHACITGWLSYRLSYQLILCGSYGGSTSTSYVADRVNKGTKVHIPLHYIAHVHIYTDCDSHVLSYEMACVKSKANTVSMRESMGKYIEVWQRPSLLTQCLAFKYTYCACTNWMTIIIYKLIFNWPLSCHNF